MIYATYYKRILSSLIDLGIVYLPVIILYYFYQMDINFLLKTSLITSTVYHFIFYKIGNQTCGEKCLGLKTVFIKEVKQKSLFYLIKAVWISSVYLPFSFKANMGNSIASIAFSIILQIIPEFRAKRQLVWDVLSRTA